jgi:DNA-binding transcriptional LysR family regulator
MERLYLETFLAIMKTRSFSKAASLLCVTQPAVSHRVKFLEERLGCQLIDRSGPELVPTEAGKCVLRKAEQILQLEVELKNEISRLEQKGKLSLGITATFGTVYLPKVLSPFLLNMSEKTDLRIAVKTPVEIRNGLLCNNYDIGVVEHLDELNLQGFATVILPDDELVFACHEKITEKQMDTPLCKLLERHLVVRMEECSCHKMLRMNLQEYGVTLNDFRGITISEDLHLMLNAVRHGEGICYVSRVLIEEDVNKGILYEHQVADFRKKRTRTLFFRAEKLKEEAPRFFIEKVLDLFAISLPQDLAQLQGIVGSAVVVTDKSSAKAVCTVSV